jgi:hypothetical protein
MFTEEVLLVFPFVDQPCPSDAVTVLLRRDLNKLPYFMGAVRTKFSPAFLPDC